MREVQKIKMEGVMRKKLMSCLVAFAFVMSIAAPSAFAAPDAVSSEANMGVMSDTGKPTNTPPTEGLQDMQSNEEINKIYSRFTSVFNYSAGVLVSVINADGGFSLIERGMARATFTKNENGTYALASFNFMPGDIDIINSMPGASGAEKIKNFLISIGAEKMLQVEKQEFGEDGNLKTYEDPDAYANRKVEKVDVAWFQVLYDHLSKGINHSASIDFQASGGPEVTLSVNGQPTYTYAAQGGDKNNTPVVKKEYIYSDSGFLVGIKELSFKVDLDSLKEGYESLKKEQEGKNLSDDQRQALYAQTNGSAKFVKTYTYTRMNAFGQPAFVEDENGKVLQKYNYSSTNSIVSMNDYVNNTTNYFVNGQFDYSVNSKGFVTARMFRFQNGMSNYMMSYNDGIATSMTVFYNNQAVITLSMAGSQEKGLPILDANGARELYRAFKDPTMKGLNEFVNKYITDATAKANFLKEVEDMTKKADELELYDNPNYEKDSKGRVEKETSKGTRVENSHEVNVKYAYISTLISKFGVTSFSVYVQDLNNQALLRVLGLDAAFEIALMRKQEEEAKSEVDKLKAEEGKMNALLESIKSKDNNQGSKLEKIGEEEKKKEEEKNKIDASKLTDEEREYYNWKTSLVEAQNSANSNNAANREAALRSIKKALQLMREFNNGASAVMTAAFSVTDGQYNKDFKKEYYENGQKVKNEDAEKEINKAGTTQGSGNTQNTVKHNYKVKDSWTQVNKKTLSINLSINTFGAARIGYTANHTLQHKETAQSKETDKEVSYTVKSDPVVIGTQGGFVGEDGKPLVNEDGSPMTNEQIAEYIENGGVVYVSVNASDVNIMDGSGFQAVDGEEILVRVANADVFRALSNNTGNPVMLMGDVTNDVDGKKTMVMNLNYGGGFVMGADDITVMKGIVNNAEADWVKQNLENNSWLGAFAGEGFDSQWNRLVNNDRNDRSAVANASIEANVWKQMKIESAEWLKGIPGSMNAKWDMIVMNNNSVGSIEKQSKVALIALALGLTASNALF